MSPFAGGLAGGADHLILNTGPYCFISWPGLLYQGDNGLGSIALTLQHGMWPFRSFRASLVAQVVKNSPATRKTWVWSLGWEDPGGGHGNPLQYSCLENPHGQRNLAGCRPWGHKESDVTEWLSTAQQLVHFLARLTLPRWEWPKHHCVNFTAWNVTRVVRTSKQESHSAVQENDKSYMNIKVLYVISLIWRVVVRRVCLLLCPMEEKSQRLLLAVALAVKSFISHCSAKAG